jgi:hypothetical protein
MKRLLILAVFGALLSGVAGCRFWECLWRGPQYQTSPQPIAACPTPCPTYNPYDPCAGAPAATMAPMTVTPGPATYAPGPAN